MKNPDLPSLGSPVAAGWPASGCPSLPVVLVDNAAFVLVASESYSRLPRYVFIIFLTSRGRLAELEDTPSTTIVLANGSAFIALIYLLAKS